MKQAIRISPTYNRKSILKLGLIPYSISLSHHLKSFLKNDLCTKDGKCIYTWKHETIKNSTRFVKDMVYCIHYIHPRNKIVDRDEKYLHKITGLNNECNLVLWETDSYYKFNQVENSSLTEQVMIYDIYSTSIPKDLDEKNTDYHEQSKSDNLNYSTYGMHKEYAHTDKPLCIFKETIKDLKIIGTATYLNSIQQGIEINVYWKKQLK